MPILDPATQRQAKSSSSSYSEFLCPPNQFSCLQQRQNSPDRISTPALSESAGDDDQATIDTEHSSDMEGIETHDENTIRITSESGEEKTLELIAEGADIEAKTNFLSHLAATSGNEPAIRSSLPRHQEPLHVGDSTSPATLGHASAKRCPRVPTAVNELTKFFVHEKRLNLLFTIAFEEKSIGAEEFERKFSALLKEFSTELELDAQGKYQGAAARLAGSYAALISHSISSRRLFPKQDSDHDMNIPQMFEEIEASNGNDLQEDDQGQIFTVLDWQKFIAPSKSLCNLRHKLSRFVQPDVIQAIDTEMRLGLKPSGMQHVTFRIQWDLFKYCTEELQDSPTLAPVLTISGNAKTAYATSCNDYMNLWWPNTGRQTLQTLQEAIGHEIYETEWPCGLGFSVDFRPEDIIITVSGYEGQIIIEIAQQLAWLSAVFRTPEYDKLTLSETILERIEGSEFRLFPLDLQEVDDSESPCWHPLFTNGVIAHGFPVPPRHEERGIELSFEVMITLAGVIYPLEYDDGMVLKGPSTILIPTALVPLTPVPTARLSNSVQWHLISGVPDKRLTLNCIADHVSDSDWFKTYDYDLLRTARTFLGYCKKAEIHLGISKSSYGNIERSNAKYERPRLEISRKISLPVGISFMGVQAAISPSIIFPKGLQVTTRPGSLSFNNQLNRARHQPLLLYDTEDKRGWLVPELSVILHIALAWASKQPDRSDALNRMPRATVSDDGGEAAYDAIMRGQDIELPTGLDGNPQFFTDVIKTFMTALDSRKEVIIEREKTLNWKRSPLRGWEFIDIVNFKYFAKREEVVIDRSSGGNWDLIAAENSELIVLFGKGFGEIIKPAKDENICQSWNPIPKGNCYLTASSFCLENLAATHSIETTSPRLTRNLHWHRPRGAKLFEDCEFGTAIGCNRLQKLKKSKPRAPGPLEWHGAVIFGRAKTSNMPSCTPLEKKRASRKRSLDDSTDVLSSVQDRGSTSEQQVNGNREMQIHHDDPSSGMMDRLSLSQKGDETSVLHELINAAKPNNDDNRSKRTRLNPAD
ncbi:hypothetical protein MMC22_009007 [Lobaria immixta]|nr:hypothetical protein [Lobaria immixta]